MCVQREVAGSVPGHSWHDRTQPWRCTCPSRYQATSDSAHAGEADISLSEIVRADATGLDAAMPPWVQAGGLQEWRRRLRDPAIRSRVAVEMRTPTDEWESLLLLAGSAARVLLVAFLQDSLKYLTGIS